MDIKTVEQCKSVEDMIKFAQGLGHKDPAFADVEQKANENVDPTTNANWYDQFGMTNTIKDLSSTRGGLISRLQEGFEGSDLPDSFPVPYDITNYKMKAKTVWRDEASPTNDNQVVTDAKGTIAPTPLIIQFGINDEMIANSTDQRIFDYIVKKASEAATNSIENMIINGDAETGATGNVNTDDAAPSAHFTDGTADDSLQIDNGLRESAINNSGTFNVGAFDSDDLNSIRALLSSQYQTKMDDQLFLFEPETYLKAQTDDALKLAINSSRPSIEGVEMKPFGVQAIPHDLVPKTEADGKASTTAGNNTLGQIVLLYKPAVRWGFGKAVLVESERVQGYGFQITVTMKFGFVILDRTGTISAGINVTL